MSINNIKEKKVTQQSFIEGRIIIFGRVTRNFALKNYISRLSAIIAKLEDKGWSFETKYIEVETPFGKGKDFEYKAIKSPFKKDTHLKDKVIADAKDLIKGFSNE